MKLGPKIIEDGEFFRVRWSDGHITDYTIETQAKTEFRRFLR